MGLREVYEPLKDVIENPSLDEAIAPSLGKVYLYDSLSDEEKRIIEPYAVPETFFSMTYISNGMRRILESILDMLERSDGKVIELPTVFGGGKTHTLLAIYHAFRRPEALRLASPRDVANRLADRIKKLKEDYGEVEVIIVDGEFRTLAPSPATPLDAGTYKVHTIWGSIAHQLGRYELMKDSDQAASAPGIDELGELFRGKPIIVLIDELAEYLPKAIKEGFLDALLGFIKRLPASVSGKRACILITMPGEKWKEKPEVLEFEKRYEHMEPVLRQIHVVLREQGIVQEPLAYEDVVKVLKKRIFGKDTPLPPEMANKIRSHYIAIYEQEEYFPPEARRQLDKLIEYYPFHPTYIETLYHHIATRPGFQRTRSVIKITRKVVRTLWKSGQDPDFIMPWHMDLTDNDILNTLLASDRYRGFVKGVEKSVFEETKDLANPELARIVANTIFVRTFTYEGLYTLAGRLPHPDTKEVIYMVYERELFERLNAAPPDVIRCLEDIGTFTYFHSKDNRHWFTPHPTLAEEVKKMAEEMSDNDPGVLRELRKRVEKMLKGQKDEEIPMIFKNYKIVEPLDIPTFKASDNREHTAIIALGPITEEQARNWILGPPDSPRNYKNTTIVISMREDAKKGLLNVIKELVACDRIDIAKLAITEEDRELQRTKLRALKREAEKKLLSRLPSAFCRVWYPAYDPKNGSEVVKSIDVSPLKHILVQAERGLKDGRVGKIVDARDLSLEIFFDVLKEGGVSIRDQYQTIGEIYDKLLSNPRFIFMNYDMLASVLERGAKQLEIGFKLGDEIYWKKIFDSEEEAKEAEVDYRIPNIRHGEYGPQYLVGRWELLCEDLVDKLLKEEGISEEDGTKVRIEYRLLLPSGVSIGIKELLQREPRKYKDFVRGGRLFRVKEELKEGFIISIDPTFKEIRPGEPIEVKVKVEPVGKYEYEVRLKSTLGKIEPDAGKPPFEALWSVTAPKEVGPHELTLTGIGKDPKKFSHSARMKLIVKGVEEIFETSLDEYKCVEGDVITHIRTEDYTAFKLLETLLGLGPDKLPVYKIRKVSIDMELELSARDAVDKLKSIPKECKKSIIIKVKRVARR